MTSKILHVKGVRSAKPKNLSTNENWPIMALLVS